jgi:hypothetical protein
MLSSLYPASSTWKVKYLPAGFIIGCKVPRDVKIYSKDLKAAHRTSPGRVEDSWCEWDSKQECLFVCCKVNKNIVETRKRRRLDASSE